MNVFLIVDDSKLFDLSKMPNIPALLDKSYKDSRSRMVAELAYQRKLLIAFDAWFLSVNPESREHIMKSLESTIPIEEIIPEGIRDRGLILEAAQRYREGKQSVSKNAE